MIFFCKYDVVISDIRVGSFLDVLYFFLAVIISELHEKPRRKDWVTEKSRYNNLCKGYHFFDSTPSFILYNFLLLSLFSLPPPFQMTYLLNDPIKIHDNALVGIACDDTMSEQSKIWQSFAGAPLAPPFLYGLAKERQIVSPLIS